MREGRVAICVIILCFFTILNPLYAQQAREKFGKNRVQYKVFDWKFYSSDNFDVYFYEGGDVAAKEAINFLEGEFDRITDVIGYSPYTKTKVFLYNSIADLQQSNVGINDLDYSEGGQTNFIKSYVEIAHPGTVNDFRQELIYNTSRLLINDMMFGGSLSDMFQSAYLLHLPTWFVEGASAYIANGWSLEMDDYIRDFVTAQRRLRLSRLTGEEAKLAGQSIWNYIAETYGRSSISNILNLTRIIRNEEKSIANTLGLSFRQFLNDWQDFYIEIEQIVSTDYVDPADALQVLEKNRKGFDYSQVKLSPDATKLAYVRNYNGRYSVWIRDLDTQNEDKVLSGGYKVINQKVDYQSPLLGWADNTTLGVVNYEKARTTLWLYDITTRTRIPTRFERFEKVHSFNFSGNGRLAIMSADVAGINDLYLVSVTRSRIKRLTNDLYDEINPVFIPNSNIILFSSNRANDTLSVVSESYKDLGDNFNLFLYNLDTTNLTLNRVTNTFSQDVSPLALNYSDFYYLSDQKGIQNVFNYNLIDSIYSQVSNFSNNIRYYDLNFNSGRAAFVMENENVSNIYIDYNFDRNRSIFTSQTKRQSVKQARFITDRRRQNLVNRSNKVEVDFSKPDSVQQSKAKEDIIDTDNYVFDKELESKARIDQPESFLSQYRRFQTQKTIFGPLDYETRFSADNLVTSWVIDPMIGFGILIETQMKDILEDHSFTGSVMGTTDFRSGDFVGEYKFLRGMIDYGFRFYRRVMEWPTAEDVPQKYKKNIIELSASYPLSVRSRFTLKPFFGNTKFEDLDFALLGGQIPPGRAATINRNYVGINSELVYDNSISRGMNIIEGTRVKITFKHWEGITDKDKSFSNLTFDFRHYQKISREFVFATRIFYGKFFGRNPQNYLLGGVDNWLFSKTKNRGDSENQGSPLYTARNSDNSDLLFLEYVTPLRGFSYNTFYGNDALVLNAELRFPVIKYFYKGPISSNFFRNLQFIGFYDIGSSWTGPNPFSEKNEVNTLVIDRGIFRSEIKNYRSPWLQSFGAGLRTVILGFFMKFDLAWPVENFERGTPKFQASFGFDF
jgi:hypothetical protein